jgi:hypothetical protein
MRYNRPSRLLFFTIVAYLQYSSLKKGILDEILDLSPTRPHLPIW